MNPDQIGVAGHSQTNNSLTLQAETRTAAGNVTELRRLRGSVDIKAKFQVVGSNLKDFDVFQKDSLSGSFRTTLDEQFEGSRADAHVLIFSGSAKEENEMSRSYSQF